MPLYPETRQGHPGFSSQQRFCAGYTSFHPPSPPPKRLITSLLVQRAGVSSLPPLETPTPVCPQSWLVHLLGRSPYTSRIETSGECLGMLFCNEGFCHRPSRVQERGGIVASFLFWSLLLVATVTGGEHREGGSCTEAVWRRERDSACMDVCACVCPAGRG